MSLKGVEFEAAWKRRHTKVVEGARIHLLSKPDLIRAKKAAGRRKDLDDIDALEGKS